MSSRPTVQSTEPNLRIESDVPGSRPAAALRFGISLAVSAAVTAVLMRLEPRQLSVVTDIVGYPIHSNFNSRYVSRYYLGILFAPALAALLYHCIGLLWPRARWPGSGQAISVEEGDPSSTMLVFGQAARALVVGAALGVGASLVDPNGGARFWLDFGTVAAGYALLVLGAAALFASRPLTVERFALVASRLDALAAPFTIASLLAASRATRVVVQSDGSVYAYPWLPGWAAAGAGIVLFAVTARACLRTNDPTVTRRIEGRTLLLVAVPVVIYLYTAYLPPALGTFDTFHFGEFLTGARLFQGGAFPWRDDYFIHGLLQDVFAPLWGFKIFGDSAWSGWAGFSMFAGPLWWVGHALLFAYLFRRNLMLLLAALALPIVGGLYPPFERFAPLPFILLALAALLERATLARAVLFTVTLFGANVLVPELAYAVVGCGAVLVAYELLRYRPGQGVLANLPRTYRVAATGAVLSLAWLVYLARRGAAAAFLGYYATFAPGHGLTGAIPHLQGTLFFVYMFLPLLLLLLAFWFLVAAARAKRPLEVRDWVMVGAALVTFLYYPKFLSRADWHVAGAGSPALPLFYYAIDKLTSLHPARRRAARLAAGGLLLGATIWLAPGDTLARLARVPSDFVRVVPGPPVLPDLGWSEPTLATQAAQWKEVDRFLDATLSPEDVLFDFSNQPGLYHYLLHRSPATRYFHVSMAIRRAVQLDLIAELERVRPKLVVFDTEANGLPSWDGIANEVRHYEISRYILRRYRPFARVAGQTFNLRNDLKIDPPRVAGTARIVAPDAYTAARPCDWGDAPRFLRSDWVRPDLPLRRENTVAVLRLSVSGWAADARSLRPAREVLVVSPEGIVARGLPDLERLDVAKALGAPALDRSGFSIGQSWTDPSALRRDDLRIYAVLGEGEAAPLRTAWDVPGGVPSELRLPDGRALRVIQHGAAGAVDVARLETELVTRFEAPPGVTLSSLSGIAVDAQATRTSAVAVADQPVHSVRPDASSTELAAPGMSFWVDAGARRTLRVMLDNCPQWYLLQGRTLYLRHPADVSIGTLRLLVRDDSLALPSEATALPGR